MNRFIKVFSKFIILTALSIVCVCGFNAYAATADALEETKIVDKLTSGYSSDYNPPFIKNEDNVNTLDLGVSIKECDLSLPGKNGLDLNIIRSYNSKRTYYEIEYDKDYSSKIQNSFPLYKYSYNSGGVTKYIYVYFESEEDLVDSFRMLKTSITDKKSTDADGYTYYKYNIVETTDTSSSTIFLERVVDEKPIAIGKKALKDFYERRHPGLDLGYGWRIQIPSITNFSSDILTTTFNGEVVDKTDVVVSYGEFMNENGEVYVIKFKTRKQEDGSKITADADVLYTSNYTLEAHTDNITHSKGFSYRLKITDYTGKSYYFKYIYENYQNRFELSAITDRFDNAILYTYSGTYGQDNYKINITDTYGREVSVDKYGVYVKDGTSKRDLVKYDIDTVYDDEARDPYDMLTYINKHKLIVNKYSTRYGSETERTEYLMKAKEIKINCLYYTPIYLLEKINYPTGAAVEYIYEDTATSNLSAGKNYNDYKVFFLKTERKYEGTSYDSSPLRIKRDFTIDKKRIVSATNVHDIVTDTKVTEYNNLSKKITEYKYCPFDLLREKITSSYKLNSSNAVEKIESYKEDYTYRISGDDDVGDMTTTKKNAMRKKTVSNIMTFYANVVPVKYTSYNYAYDLIKSVDYEYSSFGELLKKRNGDEYEEYTYGEYNLLKSAKKKINDTQYLYTENTIKNKNITESRVYDSNNSTNILKNTIKYTYNSDGTVKSENTIPVNGSTKYILYTYSAPSNGEYTVTKDTTYYDVDDDEMDMTEEYSYNFFGNVKSFKDGRGNTTKYEYDRMGRPTKTINPDNTAKTAVYDIKNNSVTVTDENGNSTTQKYTPFGQISRIYYDNNTNKKLAEYSYNEYGDKVEEKAYTDTDGKYVSAEYSYDFTGRVSSVTEKDNGAVLDTESYTYEQKTDLTKYSENGGYTYIDLGGNYKKALIYVDITGYAHNAGYSEVVIYVDDTKINKVYSGKYTDVFELDVTDKQQIKLYAPKGKFDAYVRLVNDENEEAYKGEHRVVTQSYTGDSTYKRPTVKREYNGAGEVLSEEMHSGSSLINKNMYKYDSAGNVLEKLGGNTYMQSRNSYTEKMKYDAMGNVTEAYREDGKSKKYTYDGLGRMLSETDYEYNETEYKYDSFGNLVKTTRDFNENDRQTSY